MPARRPFAVILTAVVLALATPQAARAICSASDIVGKPAEPGCPVGTGDCSITGTYVVDTGCTLDFGNRQVTLFGKLTVGSRTMTLRARRFVLSPSGILDGKATTAGARGGFIRIETTGSGSNGLLQTTLNSTVDVTGNLSGGDIVLRSAGDVSITGKLLADGATVSSAGGTIDVTAAGNFDATARSVLSATGGLDSEGGGEIDISADGHVILASDLQVSGYDGGFIEVRAGTTVDMQGARASALVGSDAGSGGCIEVLGEQGATVRGDIEASGVSGEFMTGGCGGLICLDGDSGDMVVTTAAQIIADGGPPDGGGGQIALMSLRNVTVSGKILARGPESGETCGGDICLDAGLDVSLAASGILDASGGDAGGQLEAFGGRNVSLLGPLLADGQRGGSLGGDAAARAGVGGYGVLTVNNDVDVTSLPACSVENGCGQGGLTDFEACTVTLGSKARMLVGGPEAGENNLTAREQLTLASGSRVDAKGTSANPFDGANRLLHPARKPIIMAGAIVQPAPINLALSTCPMEGETTPRCLVPCPTCGNGVQEFPETCDPGLMPPLSCQANGCSVFCQLENCDDGRSCTSDTCFADFGCRHVVTPACTEPPTPTPTVTNTRPTNTATATATPSATSTETRTPSVTATASSTASITTTPIASPTASLSPTASATPSPTTTASASPTPRASPTASAAATASATSTASPTTPPTATAIDSATVTLTPTALDTATPLATATAPPAACPGDCNGDGEVTVNELISGVNIALGNAAPSSCPAFDRNSDGEVSINELIAAVNAALTGC
ncbi:MAG: hypothetical protein SF182_24815 [Deltaproteobacteria bacterium]|nr:hypothetical protein [Deltaproteobacteria bacterium]